MQSITKNSQLIKTFCVSLLIALGLNSVHTATKVSANAETDAREVIGVEQFNNKSIGLAKHQKHLQLMHAHLKQESSEEPCTKPCANLTTDKTTYTRLEPIVVSFSYENIPYAERYRIALVVASRNTNCSNVWHTECSNASEDGTVTFKPQEPRDYEIRAYVYPGNEWVMIEKIKIKVTPDL
ncbi:hypothetical protein [Roseofilum capinflatum]|uniref:Uncharacterized protein n=1 Tax=Roseofilum capinflatum BLCC-M114 TaxID=3022440 RepID=A0ABT7B9U0_9CYAN|nr:hypothetical protein [Roseofilum capinflatum]MDJ1175936.1 hypothetical protein [Roseofilum capinflatum BLCC-M114]